MRAIQIRVERDTARAVENVLQLPAAEARRLLGEAQRSCAEELDLRFAPRIGSRPFGQIAVFVEDQFLGAVVAYGQGKHSSRDVRSNAQRGEDRHLDDVGGNRQKAAAREAQHLAFRRAKRILRRIGPRNGQFGNGMKPREVDCRCTRACAEDDGVRRVAHR